VRRENGKICYMSAIYKKACSKDEPFYVPKRRRDEKFPHVLR
jgi:hypothetical protein